MNYFEYLGEFLIIAQFRKLPASSRVTYQAILYKWNALRQPAKFALSDSELMSLTGLGSNAVTSAKRQLKNLGFIDFRSSRKITEYNLTRACEKNNGVHFNVRSNARGGDDALLTATKNNNNNKLKKIAREGGENFEFEV